MDSLNTIIGIIASALFRVFRVAEQVFVQVDLYCLVVSLNCSNNQRTIIGLTKLFNKNNVSKKNGIFPSIQLKANINNFYKSKKPSTYIKTLEIELILLFNSVYQHIPPLLLFSNALCKGKVFCMTNTTPVQKWILI